MCQNLEVENRFGYREAVVHKNVDYVWHGNCDATTAIKFILIFRKRTKYRPVSGFQLYMADYLSQALNMSMRFVPAKINIFVSFVSLYLL